MHSFNPRAPRGARPKKIAWCSTLQGFNPRAPRGARPDAAVTTLVSEAFQSTRPARGATPMPIERTKLFCGFNPRAPRGARPVNRLLVLDRDEVSIHAPRAGRDTNS